MTETFTFKETTTFKDYLAIFYYQTFRKIIVKRIFIFLIIVSIFSAILEFALAKNLKWDKVIFNLLVAPVFLVAFLYVVGFLVTILLWKFKPAIFKATNKFTHWGMERRGEGFELSIPWNKFLRYKETKKYILLYITKDDAFVIRKKLFDSDEQLEDFRHLVSEKIQPS
jgi:hypothetical protein